MNITISRVLAAAALVTCIPLSNASADDLLVAESHDPGEAMTHAMGGEMDHGAVQEDAEAAQSSSSAAPQAAVGELRISGGFTRAMLPGAKVGGGYLTIVNSETKADRLVSVSSPAAGRVELHEMVMEGDVMRMRALKDGLPIAPGQSVSLKPGGNHLMFLDVVEPFKEGASIAVILTFERAGTVEVALPVLSPGATQAEAK